MYEEEYYKKGLVEDIIKDYKAEIKNDDYIIIWNREMVPFCISERTNEECCGCHDLYSLADMKYKEIAKNAVEEIAENHPEIKDCNFMVIWKQEKQRFYLYAYKSTEEWDNECSKYYNPELGDDNFLLILFKKEKQLLYSFIKELTEDYPELKNDKLVLIWIHEKQSFQLYNLIASVRNIEYWRYEENNPPLVKPTFKVKRNLKKIGRQIRKHQNPAYLRRVLKKQKKYLKGE